MSKEADGTWIMTSTGGVLRAAPGVQIVMQPTGDFIAEVAPLPIRLPCESCHELHIDEGEFVTKPHHTHACQHCGHVWRPAVFPTVGVRFLPGFKNEPT